MSFDIRKFLTEHKLTKASRTLLKENYHPEMEEMSMEEPSMEETLDDQPADVDPTDGGGVNTSFDASKYESVEQLMREIEVTANRASLQEKMKRVKEAYEALEQKATALEEGEDSKYVSSAKLKEMKKNAKTLRKMYEKYEKDYDKRFNEQMKPKKKVNEQFDNNKMMANINALNGVLKDEVRKIVGAGFDAKNQDLDYSFLTPQNYSDNLLLTAMSDRGGVYFEWMAKEQVDEEEYEMIRNGYGDLEMLAELVDGVFHDHRGTVAEQMKPKKKS